MILRILFFCLSLCALSNCAANVITTRQRIVVPDPVSSNSKNIFPYELSKYKQNGYGSWHYGPGIDYVKRLDLMPESYKKNYNNVAITSAAKLLNFFVITDIHITDKESPAQAIYLGYKGGSPSAYSGVMLYTTQFFDAAVQTINAMHKKNKFDFGISLGDASNSAQYNEVRWYIDILDGKVITPSSGSHAGADTIDYQKPFKATGLDKSINWYQVMGNHDHFWTGFLPLNDYVQQHLVGKKIVNLGNPFIDPLGVDSRGFYMGSIDGRTPFGDIIGVGPVKNFKKPPEVLAADPNRRALLKKEWIGEFFNTSSSPDGHGFNLVNKKTGFACYTFEPKSNTSPNVPIKIIALDDTQRNDDLSNPKSLGYGHGSLDDERYNWLIKELDKGQAEGKLMIVAAHIPICVGPPEAMDGWSKAAETKLLSKLHTYPNLILWIAGHRHFNTVTALKSPDPAHPELGFWQIETASLRDFPQQFRTFEIVRNNDNTVSIFATNVDPEIKNGSLAAMSRFYAVATIQMLYTIYKTNIKIDSGSYNVECVKQLTAEMQAKIHARS